MKKACESMEDRIQDHMDRDDRLFSHLSEEISTIKSNHLAHIETDVAWLKWLGMTILGAIIVSTVTLFFKM